MGAVGLDCMGMTWAYGDSPDAEDPRTVIGRALDLGVNFLDTADVYGPFTNEETVGRAIAGRREEVVLATKGGNVARTTENGAPALPAPDGRPEHLRAAVDASLRRLGVDHVDLYYLHRPDPEVPVEESVVCRAAKADPGRRFHAGHGPDHAEPVVPATPSRRDQPDRHSPGPSLIRRCSSTKQRPFPSPAGCGVRSARSTRSPANG
ncbi:aldo/keto reductase [Nonomuraea sp. NPDC001636]|uniref:aldo/keto reductase n=1 Tax=Nonomuraea sp. NPDC001636 TaxID=3154391 RepID=UPI0033207BF8